MIFRIRVNKHTRVAMAMEAIDHPYDEHPLSMKEYKSTMSDILLFHEVNGITFAINDEKYYTVYYVEGNDIGHAWLVFNLIK